MSRNSTLSDLEAETSFIAFGEDELGLPLYDWQCRAVEPFDEASDHLVLVSLATPNGSGKSSRVIPTLALGWLALYPQGRVVITSADSKQLDNQVMPAINAHRGKFPQWKFIEREIRTPTGGSLVAFTTDDPGRAEGWHKLSDEEGPLLVIADEAKTIPEKIFDALDRCTFNGLLLTSSPGKMSGTFYESQMNPDHGFIRISVGLKDCPHIGQDKIDRIIAKHGAGSSFTRSALHGEFLESFDGKPVYYAYNQDIHEGEDLPWPKGAYLWRGHDVGTHAATVWSAYWRENGEEYWHDLFEFYQDGFDTDRHAREVLRITENEFPFWNDRMVCAGVQDAIDPAAANSSFTRQINVNGKNVAESALNIFRTYDIQPVYRTVSRGLIETITVVNRLMEKRDFQGRPVFRVDKNGCPRLVRGYRGGYRWPTSEEKLPADVPVKGLACDNLDHCFIAGTMVTTKRGDVPIERVTTDDMALTRAGWMRVIATTNRTSDVKTFRFSSGVNLTAVPSHKVWSATRNSFIPLADLTELDIVISCSNQKLPYTKGRSGVVTQKLRTDRTGSISSEVEGFFTELFGRITTDQYQTDTTSITKIISNYLRQRRTSPVTSTKADERRQERLLKRPSPPLQNGIPPSLEWNGTANTPRILALGSWRKWKDHATSAASSSSRGGQGEHWLVPDSAPTPANRNGDEFKSSITLTKLAEFAGNHTGGANMPKTRLVPELAAGFSSAVLKQVSSEVQTSRVYNITVAGAHEYFANGILVRNCQDSARYAKINALKLLMNETIKAQPPTPWRAKRRNINATR